MSPSVQLSFNLRTSSSVKSVHLIGSWDSYARQLPLSATKAGSWKGTFRFQGSQALQLGSRYWYYYIVDGYQVTHDPAKEYTVERTTGRKLNILDVPAGKTVAASKPKLAVQTQNMTRSRRDSNEIATGRSLSPSRIACPKPQKPYASRQLREADYEQSPIEDLQEKLAKLEFNVRSYSATGSDISDASSAPGDCFSSSGASTPSSCSSVGPACTCNRIGVTRDGRRVRLDCGGRRCGYDAESSACESDSEDERVSSRVMRAKVAAKAGSSASQRSARAVSRR